MKKPSKVKREVGEGPSKERQSEKVLRKKVQFQQTPGRSHVMGVRGSGEDELSLGK